MSKDVQVVGAGVVGLCCAVRLAEAGYRVEVIARDLPAQTTSAVAGAVWWPYRAEPADLVAGWATTTLTELIRLGADPATGVLLRDGAVIAHEPVPWPPWAEAVAGPLALRAAHGPVPGYAHGLAARAPVIDIPVYLDYLVARLRRAGGDVVRRTLTRLPDRGTVVNATGLGAIDLVGDRELYPVRGQTVLLDNPGLSRWLIEESADDREMTYVVPRTSDVVVGGSATEHDARCEADPELAERILARARALVPELADARVRAHRVGLRPARSAVRLEREPRPDGAVVHCYGHGGAGFTLSWGCADTVLALLADAG